MAGKRPLEELLVGYPQFDTRSPAFGARKRPVVTSGMLGSIGHKSPREECRALFGSSPLEKGTDALVGIGFPSSILGDLTGCHARMSEEEWANMAEAFAGDVASKLGVDRAEVPQTGRINESRSAYP